MKLSIRTQLLLPLLALFVGVVGLGVWAATQAASVVARQQVKQQIRDVLGTLETANYPLTEPVLRQLQQLTGNEYVLLAPDGRKWTTFAHGAAPVPPDLAEARVGMGAWESWRGLLLGPPESVGGRLYSPSALRFETPSPNANHVLVVWSPDGRYEAILSAAVRSARLLGAVGCSVAVLLAWLVARRLARRIRRLEDQTRLIACGDFRPIPVAGWRDELYGLGEAVNEMSVRLAQLHEAVRRSERLRLLGQVGGGLAHQLRNGVAGARLAVQLHLTEPAGDLEALQVALRQLTLVETRLCRFLELGGAEESRRAPCRLGAVVDDAAALVRPQCTHSRIRLDWRRPADESILLADSGELGHLVLNLVGNAMEAAGPGGTVALQQSECDGEVVLEVADDGPGPPDAIRDRLFETFITGRPEGVGLGLAVVRQTAEAHGGRVEWKRSEGWTKFFVHLPAAALNGTDE